MFYTIDLASVKAWLWEGFVGFHKSVLISAHYPIPSNLMSSKITGQASKIQEVVI